MCYRCSERPDDLSIDDIWKMYKQWRNFASDDLWLLIEQARNRGEISYEAYADWKSLWNRGPDKR